MSIAKAEQLVDVGEFQKALDELPPTRDTHVRVVRARIDLELGNSDAAFAEATGLLRGALAREDRARCLGIAGRVIGRRGQTTEGLALLRKAIACAADCGPGIEAELLGQYVTHALSWAGVEPVIAELPRLRRAALQSANRLALIQYHVACAHVAALRGARDRIWAELSAAEQLLETSPSPVLEWRLEMIKAAAAIVTGDIRVAVKSAEKALRLCDTSGSRIHRGASAANLAYIYSVAGEFERARQFLELADQLIESKNHTRFALVNTGISLGLWTGDLSLSEQMLKMGESLASSCPDDESYYGSWFALYRAQWLIRFNRLQEAATQAEASLLFVESAADTELGARIRLVLAEALWRAGKQTAALPALAEAVWPPSGRSVELLAELQRVAAICVHERSCASARQMLETAKRILSSISMVGPAASIDQTIAELRLGADCDASSLSNSDVIARTGVLLQLGRHPDTLATECLAMLHDLGVCEFGVVERQAPEGTFELARFGAEGRPSACSEFRLFAHGTAAYVVRATPTHPAEFAVVQGAMTQVAQTSAASARVPDAHESGLATFAEPAALQLGMIATAEATLALVDTARKVAASSITVLITGETGTGKELLARALHDASPRCAKPFIPFNCSAVSRELLDAQLFGYRRGAFTGATEAFGGVIRAAAGGTLFLDEIGEITLDVQPKLLRFLESGEIHPLGEPRPTQADVRVVAATNADLEAMVEAGRFREDLFYRLNVVRLHVPALRERREEIPPLIQHYLERCMREAQKSGIRFADETMEYLILYSWPGNVRQLANEVRRMVALAESGAVLMPEHLSQPIAASRRTVPASERELAPTEFVVRLDQPMSAALEHVERSMIQYALTLADGRLEPAARRLGLSRKGLYLKRQRLRLLSAEEHAAEL